MSVDMLLANYEKAERHLMDTIPIAGYVPGGGDGDHFSENFDSILALREKESRQAGLDFAAAIDGQHVLVDGEMKVFADVRLRLFPTELTPGVMAFIWKRLHDAGRLTFLGVAFAPMLAQACAGPTLITLPLPQGHRDVAVNQAMNEGFSRTAVDGQAVEIEKFRAGDVDMLRFTVSTGQGNKPLVFQSRGLLMRSAVGGPGPACPAVALAIPVKN